MTKAVKDEGETGVLCESEISPVERRVRIIFWVEAIVLLVQVGQLLAVVIAAAFFPRAFEDFILQGLPNSEVVRVWLSTLLKFSIIWACIEFMIELALLVCLYRGMTQRLPRSLRRWMVFGWIIVFFISLFFVFRLIANQWAYYSNIKLFQVIYSGVYGLYRVWANLVVLVFVNDIKVGLAKQEELEIQARRKEKAEQMNRGVQERRAKVKADAEAAAALALTMTSAEAKDEEVVVNKVVEISDPVVETKTEKKSDINEGQSIYGPSPIRVPQSDNVVSTES